LFGERERADAHLVKASLQAATSTVQAQILGHDVTYKLGAPGRHVVDNSLGVLAASHLLGADLALAALALAELKPAGRARRAGHARRAGRLRAADRRELQRQSDLDGGALALLGQVRTQGLGRRIAVLGDMLSSGPEGAKLHAALSASVRANAVDLVFCAGR
jgi:UDP-N-acetylmuramoyl-tripeptide--D-alanyl-D-alanine ligase